MYVARYLGANGFGILSFALAFTAIFGVFTDIGLNQLTIREVARDKTLTSKYLGNVTALKLILALLSFGAIAITINLMHYPPETKNVVYLAASYLILNALCVMFYSFFQAHERMEFVTFARVFNALLLLGGALYAVSRSQAGPTTFAFIYVAASFVSFVFTFGISFWKFARPKVEVDLTFWKDTFKAAWPFGLSGVFTSVYFWIGSVMLSSMKGDEVVGWFNASYRLVFALSVVPVVYFTAAFPVMSKFYVTSPESLKIINEKSIKYMLFLAAPIAVGTTLLAEKVIFMIFGQEYVSSVVALQILVWAVAFVFISSGFARSLESLNKQILVTFIAAVCAVINVMLNIFLIPALSYKGASIATLTTEFAALAFLSLLSNKIGYGITGERMADMLWRTVAAVTVMGIFVFYFRNLTLWILIPAAALLYFAVLFIIKGVDEEDTRILKQIIPNQRNKTAPALNSIKSRDNEKY